MDSAARRQKLLETTGFEPAASAVTVCGKLTARCLVSSSCIPGLVFARRRTSLLP